MTNFLQTFFRRNPYTFDKPIQPSSKFANVLREEELAIVDEHLSGSGDLGIVDIYGPKRSGKSTFCLQLVDYLFQNPKYAYVKYIPLFSYYQENDFFAFLRALDAELSQDLPKSPRLSISNVNYTLCLQRFLENFWEKVDKKYKLAKKTISKNNMPKAILILDGTESLGSIKTWGSVSDICKNLISGLRMVDHYYSNHIKEKPNVGIVLAGTNNVFDVYRSEGGTPYSPALRIELPDLSFDQTRYLVSIGFSGFGENEIYALTKSIYKRCLGHPNLTQKYCYEVYKQRASYENLTKVKWNLIDKKVAELPDVNLDDSLDSIKENPLYSDLHRICNGEVIKYTVDAYESLRILGVVKRSGQTLLIRNPVYHRHLAAYFKELEEKVVKLAVYDSVLVRNVNYLDSFIKHGQLSKYIVEDIKTMLSELFRENHSLSLEQVTELIETIKKIHFDRETPWGTVMISTLFLASDPSDASRLRVTEELREIQEKLQLAKLRDQFILHQRLAVRPEDLSQALLDVKPQIVHFSGHGTRSGELCLEDKKGNTHPISHDALTALFEQFADQIDCVVLNACYSEVQANTIAKHIDYVIGMNQAIGDGASIAFAIGFYQALGAGRTIEQAYKLGCVQIQLQGIPEHLTPILIEKKHL